MNAPLTLQWSVQNVLWTNIPIFFSFNAANWIMWLSFVFSRAESILCQTPFRCNCNHMSFGVGLWRSRPFFKQLEAQFGPSESVYEHQFSGFNTDFRLNLRLNLSSAILYSNLNMSTSDWVISEDNCWGCQSEEAEYKPHFFCVFLTFSKLNHESTLTDFLLSFLNLFCTILVPLAASPTPIQTAEGTERTNKATSCCLLLQRKAKLIHPEWNTDEFTIPGFSF